jgi:hypothetical protein
MDFEKPGPPSADGKITTSQQEQEKVTGLTTPKNNVTMLRVRLSRQGVAGKMPLKMSAWDSALEILTVFS